jgi:hypothetical protein
LKVWSPAIWEALGASVELLKVWSPAIWEALGASRDFGPYPAPLWNFQKQ